MKTAAACVLMLAAGVVAFGQNTTSPPSPTPSEGPVVYRTTGTRIGIARSIHIPADEEVSDTVVVVAGSLRLDGRARDGVVVVGGNLYLGPTADVRGEVVLVGGRIVRDPGARLRGEVTDISFGNWDTWSIGGVSFPTVEFGGVGRWVRLAGTLFRIAFLAVLMAFIVLVARAPVARVGRAAAAEPGKAFALGLAAEVLFLPALVIASLALIVTLIGIPLVALLVPAAMLLGFIALLLGFTSLACRIGEWVQDRLGWRAHNAFVATAIGLLLVLTPTLLARIIGVAPEPLRFAGWGLLAIGVALEFIVWTIGLGATLLTGFGRWSTAPPPVPPVAESGALPAVG